MLALNMKPIFSLKKKKPKPTTTSHIKLNLRNTNILNIPINTYNIDSEEHNPKLVSNISIYIKLKVPQKKITKKNT